MTDVKKKKANPHEAYVKNSTEYCFDGNTIHMLNLPEG